MKKVINMLSASHSMLFSYIYQRVSGVKIRGSKPSKTETGTVITGENGT